MVASPILALRLPLACSILILLLSVCAQAGDSCYPDVDLASFGDARVSELVGDAPLDTTGRRVAGIGDFNGDDIDDLLITAPEAAPDGRARAGVAYVVFGRPSGLPGFFSLTDLDGSNGFRIDGLDAVDLLGTGAESAGDVNDDGIDDLVLGAVQNSGTFAGKAYVLFGQAGPFPAVFDLASLDGTHGFRVDGPINSRLGSAVAGVGDVNDDGIDDVAFGAPFAFGEDTASGQTFVLFGRTSGFPATIDATSLDGTNGFVLNGIGDNENSGTAVGAAGDLNFDGIADLILGGPNRSLGPITGAGAAYVVFGRNTAFPASLDLSALDGTNGFAIPGKDFGDGAGSSVGAAGDLNADGIDDALIGAPFVDQPGQLSVGEAYVLFGSDSGFPASVDLSGLDGTNGLTLRGGNDNDFGSVGISVAAAGDLTGDGIDDAVIGGLGTFLDERPFAGAAFILFGCDDGFPALLELPSGLDGTNGFMIVGATTSDQLGFDVSSAGDFDEDGLQDLLLGAPNARGRGSAYVVYGRRGPFLDFIAPTPAEDAVLNISAEALLSFEVRADDECDSETVMLAASVLPPGGDFTSDPGNPAAGTFEWTPTVNDIGDHLVRFVATNEAGDLVERTVTVRVAECFALIATGFGREVFEAGHAWTTWLDDVQQAIPVLMESPASIDVRLPKPTQQTTPLSPTRPARLPGAGRVVGRYFVQIVMWNPVVYPDHPEQSSQGLRVVVLSDGTIRSRPFGLPDGMHVSVSSERISDDTVRLSFPFTIQGD